MILCPVPILPDTNRQCNLIHIRPRYPQSFRPLSQHSHIPKLFPCRPQSRSTRSGLMRLRALRSNTKIQRRLTIHLPCHFLLNIVICGTDTTRLTIIQVIVRLICSRERETTAGLWWVGFVGWQCCLMKRSLLGWLVSLRSFRTNSVINRWFRDLVAGNVAR